MITIDKAINQLPKLAKLPRSEIEKFIAYCEGERGVQEAILEGAKEDEDVADVLARVRELGRWIEEGKKEQAKQPVERQQGLTHRQLMETEFTPIQWMIQDLLPVGVAILAGKPKIGKSWMALQMAQAVASGARFLGLETTEAPVLLLCLEDSGRRIKSRLMNQHAPPDLPIEYEWDWPALDGEGFDMLAQRLNSGGGWGPYGLVIIDTLASAKSTGIDENKAGDMAGLIYPLQRLAHEYQCALMLVFHHRKGAIDDPIWDIRGSGATPGAVDVLIGLYKDRNTGDFFLLTASRDAPELELKVEFDGHETFAWQSIGDLADLARSEAEEDILTALAELEEADATSIAKELGKTYKPVWQTIKRLKARGVLLSRSEKTKGRSKVIYRLSE